MICEKCKGDCFKVDIGKLERASYMIIAERPAVFETVKGTKFTKASFHPLHDQIRKLNFNEPIYATYLQKLAAEFTVVRARKCHNHLLAEIDKVKPKVILCIGASTARFITGKSGYIMDLRKSIYYDERFKAWIVCTYDPIQTLTNRTMEIEFALDLQNFKHYKYERPNKPKSLGIITSNSVAKNIKILKGMLCFKKKEISFDIETEGVDYCIHEILAIGFAWNEEFAYCIPKKVFENEEIQKLVNQLFETDNIFIGQNAKFDVSFLRYKHKKIVIPNARYDEDTMLQHYCICERTGTQSLKAWAKDYFNAPDWESDIKKYLPNKQSLYSLIPQNVLMKYLAHDVHYTYRGHFLFQELMKKENTTRSYYEILLPASKAFTEIELEGVLLDVKALKEKMAIAEPEMERISKEFLVEANKVGWSPKAYVQATKAKSTPTFLNLKSSKQMQWLMYDLCDMPLWNMGRDGYKKSCCKNAVEVYRFRHPLWAKLYEYKQVNDLFGIYVKGMLERVDEDNRIRPDFYLTGTVTGRISCHDPNLQNIPRKSFVKQMFIASPDHVIINVDYKTLEVVVASILSGDKEMQAPFIKGSDFHSQTTEGVYGDELAELKMWCNSTRRKEIVKYLERPQMAEVRDYIIRDYLDKEDWLGTYDQIFDYLRFLTKFITFGVLYGRGPKSLAEGELNCSIEEAQLYINNLLLKYPRFTEWMSEMEEHAMSYGFVQTAFGHKRRWPLIGGFDDYRVKNQSVNTPIQGTAAQITLRALHILHEKLKRTPWGRILFTVHDSIVFEIHKKQIDNSCNLIRDVMERNPISKEVPLKIDVEIGKTYGDVFPLVENNGLWLPKHNKNIEKFEKLVEV